METRAIRARNRRITLAYPALAIALAASGFAQSMPISKEAHALAVQYADGRTSYRVLRPSGGTATVNGFDVVKQTNEVRRSLGTVHAGPELHHVEIQIENPPLGQPAFELPRDILHPYKCKISDEGLDRCRILSRLTNPVN